jgi:hypothetical protein
MENHSAEAHTVTEKDEALMQELGAGQNIREEKSTLPILLRRMGAFFIVVSAAIFLLQQWETHDHVSRYYSFLGFTVLMTVIGVFSGVVMRDVKAARTLLGITALIVPIHFARLGGLLFSCMEGAKGLTYPSLLRLQASSFESALLANGIGALILAPITYFAISVFVRSSAKQVTSIFLIVSGLLLVPIRDSNFIGYLVVVSLLFHYYLDRRLWLKRNEFRTKEGHFIRILLYVPTLILGVRSLYLYAPSLFLYGIILGGIAMTLFRLMPEYMETQTSQIALQYTALVPALASSICLSIATLSAFEMGMDSALDVPIVVIPLGILLIGFSRYAIERNCIFIDIALSFVALTLLGNQLFYPGVTSAIIFLPITVLSFIAAYVLGKKFVVYFLGSTLLASLLHQLSIAIDISTYSPWMVLALCGLGTVFISSYIEKYGVTIPNLSRESEKRE